MCNDYGNRVPYSAYLEAFSQLKIRLFAAGGPPNLEPRDDIWPTDVAPIIRSADGGAELIQLRWGFPPGRPKGLPIINMRSEGGASRTAAVSFRLRIFMNLLESGRQKTSGVSPK
jgi:putative SOS response-associated peptidase YedK